MDNRPVHTVDSKSMWISFFPPKRVCSVHFIARNSLRDNAALQHEQHLPHRVNQPQKCSILYIAYLTRSICGLLASLCPRRCVYEPFVLQYV